MWAGFVVSFSFTGSATRPKLGETEISQFLTYLAVEGRVSASTQNQALCALIFLYREVLQKDLEWLSGVVRARRPVHLPVVLSRAEVTSLLGNLGGVEWIMASLLYGAGLRLECCRLRIKDVEFARKGDHGP